MKKRYIIIAILVFIAFLLSFPIRDYCHSLRMYYKFHSEISPSSDFIEEKKQNSYFPIEFNETSRLFYLCKVWGFVKYYEEDVPIHKVDSVLISLIPRVVNIESKTEYQFELNRLIDILCLSPQTRKGPYPNIEDYALIDNGWMGDTVCLNREIENKLNSLFLHHSGLKSHFVYNKSMVGNIRLSNEPEYPDFPDETIRLLGLFRYWNLINYFYVHKNHIDDNWDKVLYETIPRFRSAISKKEYHKEVYRLTNYLKDTHTSNPPTIDGIVFGSYRPNFRMKLVDSTFIINKIRLPEYNTGDFRIGDIVLQVDGQDVHQLSDSLGNYVCGGNYWSNQRFLCNAVLSRSDSTTLFKVLRGSDTLNIQSRNHQVYGMFQEERKREKKNEKSALYRWVNDSIAYMDLRSATRKNFKKNYNSIKSAAVIILDLRCYPYPSLALDLTNAFVPPNSFFAYTTYPVAGIPGLVRYTKSSTDKVGSKKHFKGRLIVLVDEHTESYSEYLTMAFQVNPQTITVGNQTSGADGSYSLFEFPGGVKTLYTGVGIYYPDLTPTQRIGIRVDHTVEPTIESIKKNIDIAYEEAILIAKQPHS